MPKKITEAFNRFIFYARKLRLYNRNVGDFLVSTTLES